MSGGHQFHIVGKEKNLPTEEIREIIDVQHEKEWSNAFDLSKIKEDKYRERNQKLQYQCIYQTQDTLNGWCVVVVKFARGQLETPEAEIKCICEIKPWILNPFKCVINISQQRVTWT